MNQAIVQLAQSITPQQREEMHRLQNLDPREVVNLSYNSDTDFLQEAGELTHMIGVLTTETPQDGLLDQLPMAAHTWAVFPNEGPFPATMQQTMANIYAQWLGSSGYRLACSLSFSFTKMDPETPGHAYSEIWVPVVRED